MSKNLIIYDLYYILEYPLTFESISYIDDNRMGCLKKGKTVLGPNV